MERQGSSTRGTPVKIPQTRIAQRQLIGETMNNAEHLTPAAGIDARQIQYYATPPADASPAIKDPDPPESPFITSKELVRQYADTLRREFGERLSRMEALRVAKAFRTAFVPRRRAGRRPSMRVTRAYEDWKTGKRGIQLYREHIPRWSKLSRWRREREERKLMAAIHSRRRRCVT